MNNFTANNTVSFTNIIYIASGSLAIVGNVLLLIVICSRLEYLKRSAFLFGLAVCDTLHGVAIMVSAVLRTIYQTLPASQSMIRPTYCMVTVTPLWIIGNQGTALMLLLIGIERFIAVQFFAWYRIKWTKKLSWSCMCLVIVFCTFSIGLAYYLASIATVTISINCYFIQVVSKSYNYYNYGVSISAGFGANIGTILSLILCLIKLNRFRNHPNTSNATVQGHIKKQWQLSKAMIGCTVCDLGLVVIPNILMSVISGFDNNSASTMLSTVTTCAPPLLCIKGFLNLFCCLLFNPEFRRHALRLLRVINVSVVPASVTGMPRTHQTGKL